jgi:DNA-binding NarL/FixJ family response regulator
LKTAFFTSENFKISKLDLRQKGEPMISQESGTKQNEVQLRVAIAEDHLLLRESLVDILNGMGHEVVAEAGDGSELLIALEELSEAPDVCLVDIKMDGMNGVETTREIRKRWKETKVLALTSFEDEQMVINMICAGAQGYLLKKHGRSKLAEALQLVYSRGVYFNEPMNSRLYHAVQNKEIKPVQLSDLERKVLTYTCSDHDYSKIAEAIGTTRRSVESARDRLFDKFEVHSRVSLALIAIRFGFAPIESLYEGFNCLK